MHLRTRKQVKDISLTENNAVLSGKKELAELFNRYFVHIDGPDILEQYFGNDISSHSSIRAIVKENSIKVTTHNSK